MGHSCLCLLLPLFPLTLFPFIPTSERTQTYTSTHPVVPSNSAGRWRAALCGLKVLRTPFSKGHWSFPRVYGTVNRHPAETTEVTFILWIKLLCLPKHYHQVALEHIITANTSATNWAESQIIIVNKHSGTFHIKIWSGEKW